MGVKEIKNDAIQYHILMNLMPYRIAEKDVLIDQISNSKDRQHIARIIRDMEKKNIIERMVIYRKSVTNVWQILTYENATIYQRRVGYVVERLTPPGFIRLCELAPKYAPYDSYLRSISVDSIRSLPWGTTQGKADASNRCRKKQVIRNTMTMLHVMTPDDKSDSDDEDALRSEAQPRSIIEAIQQGRRKAAQAPRHPSPAGEKTFIGRYYEKSEISKQKKFSLDNMMGALVIGDHAYAVYHTDSYYGTAWAPEYKKTTEVEISSFLYRKGIGQRETSTAMLFTSSVKEFADILRTAHGDKSDAKKYFLGYMPKIPTETKNIAVPFKHCIIVPEQRETINYIKFVIRPDAEQLEEQLLGAALIKSYPDGIYNITGDLKEDEKVNHIKGVFSIPENEADKAMFLKGSFPFSAVLSSSPDAPVIPVLLGYRMDLTRISRAYFFYHKSALIGTLPLHGQQHRALIIACFDWQRRWYKRIFPDAIYFEK